MKCTIPEISWHNRDPVLSLDIQPSKVGDASYRLATGGSDSHVLIWLLSVEKGGHASLECAADLSRHCKPVNCVRFSPSGELLASGDDEACIILWKMKTGNEPAEFPSGDEEIFKEQWISAKVLRGHLQDVYDLCWSADSKNLISGSVDNTAILWDVSSGKNLGILTEHKGFVQGVAWDPCGQYVATMSSDRNCRIYNASTRRVVSRLYKGHLPGADSESKPTHFFHDDTLKSFFRRLTFTPDGELLIVPSGVVEEPEKTTSNSTIIISRNCLQKPAVYLPSLNQHSVAVRCCPVLFTLRPMESPPLFDLPYRVVIAVATQSSVILYDTQHAAPFAFITKIHYTRLTDVSWSNDGRVLVVSSTDGYCSVITFAENELGTVYKPADKKDSNATTVEKKSSGVVAKEISQAKQTKLESEKSESEILCQSEDANMSFEVNGDEKEPEEKDVSIAASEKDGSCKIADSKPSSASVPDGKDTPMEVDDFQLVYEGTITEAGIENKTQTEQSKNIKVSEEITKIVKENPENTNLANKSIKINEKSEETANLNDKLSDSIIKSSQSPQKCSDSTKSLQEEALTSPKASGSSGPSVTPGNSSKKTPRRVQLITLSSPKSKKKLLD